MKALPFEIFEAIAYHAARICTFRELLELRRVNISFQFHLETVIFDHLHGSPEYRGESKPYLATGTYYLYPSKAHLHEHTIHPSMLARMIVRDSQYWRNSKYLLSSQVQRIVESLGFLRIHRSLSIEGDDETDLLLVTIGSNGPAVVTEMLRADAQVELSGEQVQHGLLALFAHRNDIDGVRTILESGTRPGTLSGIFGSITHVAARNGHHEIIQLLSQHGADINGPVGLWRGNCLQMAALGGHAKTVNLLLRKDLGLNFERNDFEPGLLRYLTRNKGHFDVDSDITAAILCSISAGNDLVVESLLKEVEARRLQLSLGGFGCILRAALQTGRETCVQSTFHILRYPTQTLDSALSKAVITKNQFQVSQILAGSTLQTPQSDWTSNALAMAASSDLIDYLNPILEHGDIISPWSAVHILCTALSRCHHGTTHILLSHRIGFPYVKGNLVPPIRPPQSHVPLTNLYLITQQEPLSAAACWPENLEILQKFMDNGTSLTHNEAGAWALNAAAWFGNTAAVQILLRAGVDAAAAMPSNSRWNPMKLAIANEHEAIVQVLERSGQEFPKINAKRARFAFTYSRRPPQRLCKEFFHRSTT